MQIYLTNLGKYNEGELVGEWLDIPFTDDELNETLENIGIGEVYEEYFITDYEAPFEIDEYEDLEGLSDKAERAQEIIDRLGSEDAAKEFIENFGIEQDIDDLSFIHTDSESDFDLAWAFIEEFGGIEEALSKEQLESYFDYEAFGRDLTFDYTYLGDGIWVSSY